MTIILLKPDELTKNTILGGNIDVDRYVPCIKAFQNTHIKPLLGVELYTKISQDFYSGSLSGNYLTLYEDYVKEMVIHGSAMNYVSIGAYMVSNNGITKLRSDSSETVNKDEVDYLVNFSEGLYDHYERQFLAWIKINPLPEYPVDSCTLSGNRILVGGWSLIRQPKCNGNT